MSFSNTPLVKYVNHVFHDLLIYMTSFATITQEEYRKLVDNERKFLI